VEEDKSVKPGSDTLPKVIWIGAIIVILSAFVLLLWRVGLFNENNAQSSGQIIAGVLALFGVIVTASVALTGYFLKRSFDQHSLRLQQTTEERLKQEGEQNTRRLDMETAIEAVKLMSAPDGKEEAPDSQKSGALFALVTLDQIDLAMALLSNLWKRGAVDTEAAIWVIDRAFQSSVRRHQIEAGTFLDLYAENLSTEKGGICWPECFFLDWRISVDLEARLSTLSALMKILPSKPVDFWRLNAVVAILGICQNVIIKEPDPTIRAGAVLFQHSLLQYYSPLFDETETISTCGGSVSFETMKGNRTAFAAENGEEAAEIASKSYLEASERIVEWLSQKGKATN